jgi:hypothetical protein
VGGGVGNGVDARKPKAENQESTIEYRNSMAERGDLEVKG